MTKLREKSKNVLYAAVNAVGGQERAVWARGHRKYHGKCDCVWRDSYSFKRLPVEKLMYGSEDVLLENTRIICYS